MSNPSDPMNYSVIKRRNLLVVLIYEEKCNLAHLMTKIISSKPFSKIRKTGHHPGVLIYFYWMKEKGLVFSNPSSKRVFTELESHLSNILLTSGLRVRISQGLISRYYHKVIDLGNKSKATFLKVDLTYRIDETDGTNLPIHLGCLPVFSSIIIHP